VSAEEGKITTESKENGDQPGIPVRLGCGSIIVFTILCSIFVLTIVKFVVDGEINIQRRDLEGYRVWLVRNDGIRGIGISSSKEIKLKGDPHFTCIETKVRFLEWRSEGESGDTDYCECYISRQGEWAFSGECPP
jgi:hypothetical protein